MWITLLRQYWEVASFRKSPADTPYSYLLLAIITIFFYFLIVIQWSMADSEGFFSLPISFLAAFSLLLSYFIYTYVILWFAKLSNRFVQTLCSLISSHAIIHLFAFPLLLLAPLFDEKSVSVAMLFVALIYLICTLALTFWQFMITVHIYRHALNLDNIAAILASLGLIACNILTVSLWR